MRAGLLRDIVTFKRAIRMETDYSASEPVYEPFLTAYAYVRHSSGGRGVEAGGVANDYTVSIDIRAHYHGLLSFDTVIAYGGEDYRILDMYLDRAGNRVSIKAERINGQERGA